MTAIRTSTQLEIGVPAIDVFWVNHSMTFLPKRGPLGDPSTAARCHGRSAVNISSLANGAMRRAPRHDSERMRLEIAASGCRSSAEITRAELPDASRFSTVRRLLCGVPDLLNFFQYVTLFGNVFSPVAGVLVFDYLFVRRMQIDVVVLYDPKGRYWYSVGFNPLAVVWTAIGFLICTYAIPTAWIPALLTLLVTGVGYSSDLCS